MSKVAEACKELELDTLKCKKLENIVDDICSGKKPKVRKRSLWQECIATRRKGQRFDPEAIKKLAVEYRAGKCP